jgi:hypothetical protein
MKLAVTVIVIMGAVRWHRLSLAVAHRLGDDIKSDLAATPGGTGEPV